MAGQVIFISGGNRGVGFELVKQYASVKGNTVVATTRNVEKSPELATLANESGNIKIVTVDLSSQASIDALEKELPKVVSSGIDIFIANAAIAETYTTILETARSEYDRHYNINVLGTIFLTKILHPYLLKRETRKIILISSVVGQINDFIPISLSAYGQSKASLNYTAKALSFELDAEKFTVVPIHPGVVNTDMGSFAKANASAPVRELFETSSISPLFSGESIRKVVDSLTRDSNGKFYSYDGSELTY